MALGSELHPEQFCPSSRWSECPLAMVSSISRSSRTSSIQNRRTVSTWILRERASQNIEPQHPPNQKKADDCDDNVANPLARRLWISEIEHVGMVASARKAESRRTRNYDVSPIALIPASRSLGWTGLVSRLKLWPSFRADRTRSSVIACPENSRILQLGYIALEVHF
jgi:hypothetical protein